MSDRDYKFDLGGNLSATVKINKDGDIYAVEHTEDITELLKNNERLRNDPNYNPNHGVSSAKQYHLGEVPYLIYLQLTEKFGPWADGNPDWIKWLRNNPAFLTTNKEI